MAHGAEPDGAAASGACVCAWRRRPGRACGRVRVCVCTYIVIVVIVIVVIVIVVAIVVVNP